MSKNTVWLTAIIAAVAGALIAGGAVWAVQSTKTNELTAQVAASSAKAQLAVQDAATARQQIAALKNSLAASATSSAVTTTTAAGATTATTPNKKTVKLKEFAYVKKVVDGTKPTLTADYALMLTGKAAAKAATAHGDESPPPNDYYIVNDNKLLRKLPVKSGITVTSVSNDDGTSDPTGHVITFAKWASYYAAPTATNVGIRQAAYWLTIRNGVVTKISEQYLP